MNSQYPEIPGGNSDVDQISDAVIRNFCGWHVTPVIDETLILDGNGSKRLCIPSLQVEDVIQLKIRGTEVVTYSWSADGWLTLPNGSVFPDEDRCVEVTVKHGFRYAPEIAQVKRGLQSRAAMSPAGNIVHQRAGSQSVTFGSVGGEVRGMSLLQQEQEILAKYRLNWGW